MMRLCQFASLTGVPGHQMGGERKTSKASMAQMLTLCNVVMRAALTVHHDTFAPGITHSKGSTKFGIG